MSYCPVLFILKMTGF